ncbi:MAG: ester cyclase [Thermoleophilia bacterium]
MGTLHDTGIEAAALRSFEVMATGDHEDFVEIIHPAFVNHEAIDEPPAARVPYGPDAAMATALWLREAFADLRWEVHEVVSERDLVVVHCTMSGRHVKPFVGYAEDGSVNEAFPPTGRTFAVSQTHWMRMADGRMIEHWANRDDMGMALQLGWVPPSPLYLVKMAMAKRRARRAA